MLLFYPKCFLVLFPLLLSLISCIPCFFFLFLLIAILLFLFLVLHLHCNSFLTPGLALLREIKSSARNQPNAIDLVL